MKKSDFLIKVSNEGETLVHIKNIGPTDHLTVCGLDGEDDALGQAALPLERGDKMNCHICRIFYDNRKGLNISKRWLDTK